MAWVDSSCDMCHKRTYQGKHVGGVYLCRTCAQKVADDGVSVIPSGCVYRFFFYHWLVRSGHLSEGVAKP